MPPNPNLVPPQFGDPALTAEEAYAACGPAAAVAFARANGRNPTLREAQDLAKRVGWTPEGGMNGIANQQRLLEQMGIAARIETKVDANKLQRDIASGNPVTISTGAHYFVLDAYDRDSGRYHVGNSGTALRSGSKWMSLDEMDAISRKIAGSGINGVLYLDSPASPQPSVAVTDQKDAAQPGTTSGVGAGGNMDQQAFEARLAELEARHGKLISTRALDPQAETGGTTVEGVTVGATEGPNPSPTYRYLFEDGTYIDAKGANVGPLASGLVEYSIVGGTALKPETAGAPRGGDLSQFQPVKNPNSGKPTALYNPTTGQTINLPEGASPSKPERFTHEGAVYVWDGVNLPKQLLEATPAAPKPQVTQFGNDLVEYTPGANGGAGTVRVIASRPQTPQAPSTVTAGDGSIWQWNFQTQRFEPSGLPGKPAPAPQQITGGLDRPELVFQGPEGITTQANPVYRPEIVQQLQNYQATVKQIQGMMEQGQLDPAQGAAYTKAAREALDASLKGTTPFQEQQHQDEETRLKAGIGQQLLNQRVSSGVSAANQYRNDILGAAAKAGTKPVDFSQFSPERYAEGMVNRLGGGPQIGNIASQFIQAATPQGALPQPQPIQNLGTTPPGVPPHLALLYWTAKQAGQNGGGMEAA